MKAFVTEPSSSLSSSSGSASKNYLYSTIPVYIFNPSNLISSSTCYTHLLKDYLRKSTFHVVILDCNEIESKTDFFAEIFTGIIKDSSLLPISYDFSAFLNAFKMISPVCDIVLLFKNSSQVNLSYLNDFVRLWERKSKDFPTIPQLRFVFDDSVSFIGMEARLRDRFQVKEVHVPSVQEVFDELIVEMIRNNQPILLHPILMKRFVELTGIASFNSLMNQFKFLIISHFSCNTSFNPKTGGYQNLKDILLFTSELATNLKKIRPSCHFFSPSKDFYPIIFAGILSESQVFVEICNELKSLMPNDFVSLFAGIENNFHSKSELLTFVKDKIISDMREKVSSSSGKSNLLKDCQLNLINSLMSHLKSIPMDIPETFVIVDPRGNVRRAFDADPQVAVQTALKYPLVYLNCGHYKTCCTSELFNFSQLSSSNLNSQLKFIDTNRPGMLDTCLLYRLSLEFNSKSINIFTWYKSFVSVISEPSQNANKKSKSKQKENETSESCPLLM